VVEERVCEGGGEVVVEEGGCELRCDSMKT
jgi:hypothetical protein